MPDSFVLAFVPGVTPAKWVSIWKQRMPHSPITLVPCSELEALQSVRDGIATAALLRLPFDGAGLSVIPLYEEVAVVVASTEHPLAAFDAVTLAELSAEAMIDGQNAAAVELAAANVGVAVMPHSIARLHNRKDVVARTISDAPTTRVALAWRADDDSPLIEEFIGIVRGRTANSSRGAETPPRERPAPKKREARATKSRRR